MRRPKAPTSTVATTTRATAGTAKVEFIVASPSPVLDQPDEVPFVALGAAHVPPGEQDERGVQAEA